ncbi:signal recognition particle 19 kDa protein isoform 2-T2 [Rhynochetos jubatus]
MAAAAAATAASPTEKERFICIYPAYLNNKKTIAEGRRIPIDKAVENPTSTEIQDVCAAVGFNVLLELKLVTFCSRFLERRTRCILESGTETCSTGGAFESSSSKMMATRAYLSFQHANQ